MKNSFKALIVSFLMIGSGILLLPNLTVAQGNKSSKASGKTVLKVVNSNKNTSKFAQLLKQSGYSPILKRKGPYTVLAPDNKAIDNTADTLKAKPKQLMKGQLFKGEVSKDKVESQMGVKVHKTDKTASNGVVYVVDKVTQPQR